MSAPFERLFTPLNLGHITLRNRVAMMPHAVTFNGGYGAMQERIIDYHVERAKGGAGLIVMSNFLMPASWLRLADWGGALKISPLGGLDLANDRHLQPLYRRLIDGVHENGAHFVSQLNASGRQLRSPGTTQFGIPLFAPSPLPCPRTGEVPKEMTRADIAEYVATMAEAAINLKEAGADGVELFAAQGYLIHEFLSPSTNWRIDEYGGSLENRMRFLCEAVAAVRHEVGPNFLIGIRMNCIDHVPGGLQPHDAMAIAEALAKQPINYLNISGKTSLTYPGWISDITAPEAQFATYAGQIKKAVGKMPIGVSSRISTPETAEAVLRAGNADFVGLARALISDPAWPRKAMNGERDDIRFCTYSNQSCIVGLDRGRGLGCVHNVAVGREAQLGLDTMRPAQKKKKVAVVGGGPAGMAAARIAAERGHEVTLYERQGALGGQNRMTCLVPSRRGYAEIGRWQMRMLEKCAVTVLNVEATADLLLDAGYDAIIIATGSVPKRSGYTSLRPDIRKLPGVDLGNVFSVWDTFERRNELGQKIVVIEDDPHLAGTAAAEFLAHHGHTVTLVTPHLHAGADLPIHHVPSLYRHLAAAGVEVLPAIFVSAIEDNTVKCVGRFDGKNYEIEAVESVVLAMGNAANNLLSGELERSGKEVLIVGDALAPRQIDVAILEGERAGWTL
jgi:2,4-dienoyl-CoA reductase-like NADH-dependent reductase (Old Yellow Enzyme family)/thioredoxin reductase